MSAARRSQGPAAALAALAALAASTLAAMPVPATAAFEVRDTSPAALGAASMDLDAPRFFDPDSDPRADAAPPVPALRVDASHASLYGVDGLSADRVTAALGARSLVLALSLEQVGGVGAREGTARLALRERAARPVSLEAAVERLDLSADGASHAGGWALSGGAEAVVPFPRVRLEIGVDADRILRSADLEALRVGPSLALAIRARTAQGSIALLDRWEIDGRRSPRLVLEVPLGGAAAIRLARGESPGRTGAALAVRVGRLDAAVGRLDFAWGGDVTGLSVGLLPGSKRWGER